MGSKRVALSITLFFLLTIIASPGAPVAGASASAGDSLPSNEGVSKQSVSSCPCPAMSGDWALAPDTMGVPSILCSMKPIPIKRMIVCNHGVFLCFNAGADGNYQSWWLAFVPPSKERYRPYVKDGEAGSDYVLITKLDAEVIKDRAKYTDMHEAMKELLGSHYNDGKIIHFDRTHIPPPTFLLEDKMKIKWKNRSVEFRLMPELYYRENGS